MTPEQRSAYDSYPQWVAHLVAATDAIKSIPLDELLNANARIRLVGGHFTEAGTEPADPVAMARQESLIRKAIAYRDAVVVPA